LSNQKQLIVAWTVYSGDNNENLVLNGGDANATSTSPHLWAYGGNHGSPETLTNQQFLVGANFALFAPLLPAAAIYRCPADKSLWPLWDAAGMMVPEIRSYAMNSYIGTLANLGPDVINPTYKLYQKTSLLNADSPVNRFVFMDVNPANICTPAFGVDMTLATWIHYPSDLHRQRGVIVFADGHTEVHHWLDNRTMPLLASGTFIGHNDSGGGDADLAWIAAHTTSTK
jgi:hypothetical protein